MTSATLTVSKRFCSTLTTSTSRWLAPTMSRTVTSGRTEGEPRGIMRGKSLAVRSTARVPSPKTTRARPSSGRMRGLRRKGFQLKPTPAYTGRK